MKPRDDVGQDGPHPHGPRSNPQAAGAAGEGGVDLLLGDLDLVEDVACQVGHHGAERREPDARRHAVEEPAAELAFEPCDHPRERRLRDAELVGCGEDGAGLRDSEKFG